MRSFSKLLCVTLSCAASACSDTQGTAPVLAEHPKGVLAASTVPADAEAYYPLDGSLNEATNELLDGTQIGNLLPVQDRHGRASGALAFDGDSSWAVLPGSPTDFATALTINLWLRRAAGVDLAKCGRTDLASPYTCQHNILAKATADGATSLRAQFLGVPVNSFYLLTGADQYTFSPNLSLSPVAWHMYTFVRNGSTQMIYFDGVKLEEGPASNANSGTGNLFLGHNGHPTLGTRERLEGAVDDLRIFRRALSDEEVCALAMTKVGSRQIIARGRLVRGSQVYPAAVLTYDQALDDSDIGSNPGIELWADETLTRRLERSNDNNGQWDYSVHGAFFRDGTAVVFGVRTGSHGPQPREWQSSGGYFLLQQSTYSAPQGFAACSL